jgi:hypothetical protein
VVGAHVVDRPALDHGQDPVPRPDVLAQQLVRARERVDLVLRDAVSNCVSEQLSRFVIS